MLRSLGSSLVAKSSPGGRLRDLIEQAMTIPQIPGKGAIGSISRAGIEEPLKREVPAGSEKIVGATPVVQSQAGLPADILPSEVGMPMPIPEGANPSVSALVPSGSRGQALFQGGVGGQPSAGGATVGASRPITKQVSSGVPFVEYKAPEVANQPPQSNTGQKTTNQNYQPNLASVPYRAPDVRNFPSFAHPVQADVVPTPTPTPRRVPTPAITPAPQRAASAPRSNLARNVFNQLRSIIQNWFSRLRSRRGRRWW